jgi:hypothetical protein
MVVTSRKSAVIVLGGHRFKSGPAADKPGSAEKLAWRRCFVAEQGRQAAGRRPGKGGLAPRGLERDLEGGVDVALHRIINNPIVGKDW